MATYIPGVTDYIPQIQPFQPDYNFLGNVMQTKQSRYDAAHKQLSSVYGTLLNSPILRDENIASRNEFFKTVDGDIKRISGVDLSLKQNQDAAMQVFKPFYEDKDMHNDMVWTKNYHTELQKAENLRNCIDPEKCGGQHWDGGVQALQFKAKEFKDASREQAMGMSKPTFTPLVNVMDKAMKAAKDAGFKISYDTVEGGYTVTTKNGDRMVAPLKSFFLSKFGGDPSVTAYYKTQAYIQRKGYIAQRAEELGGEDKAMISYMDETMKHTTQVIDKAEQKAEKNHNKVTVLKDALADRAKKKGILPSDQKVIDMMANLEEESAMTSQTKEVVKSAGDKLRASKNFSNSMMAMGDHLDDLMGFAMLDKEVGNAAKAYADLTSERDLKADPYALASYQSNLSLKNMMAGKDADFKYLLQKEQYESAGKDADFKYWLQKEQYKSAMVKSKVDKDFGEGTQVLDARGTASDVTNSNMAVLTNLDALGENKQEINGRTIDFVSTLANELKTQYANTAKDPTKQNLIAQTAETIFNGTGIDGRKIANGDAKEMTKLQSMRLDKASKAFEQASKNIDPVKGGPTGLLNDFWGRDFWNKTREQRGKIKDQKEIRGQYINWLETQSNNVTEYVAGKLKQEDPELGTQKADLVRLLAETNHEGFLPIVTAGSSTANNIAYEYANRHQKEFPGWQQAYNFAATNMESASNKWYNGYKDVAKSFDHATGFGKNSNARMTGAYEWRYDSAYPSNNNTVRLNEFIDNTTSIGSNAIIQFGDAGELKGTDPAAKALFDEFVVDFKNVDTSTDKDGNLKHYAQKRPLGTYRAQGVAANDPNMMAYTVVLNSDWLNRREGTTKNPKVSAGIAGGTPITIFIPKEKATSSFYQGTKYTTKQFLFDKKGASFDDYPEAGKINIERVGKQIQISGHLIGINSKTGAEEMVGVSAIKSADTALDIDVLERDWNQKLAALAQQNYAQKEMVRLHQGAKGFQALQKMMQEEGLKQTQ